MHTVLEDTKFASLKKNIDIISFLLYYVSIIAFVLENVKIPEIYHRQMYTVTVMLSYLP